MRIAILNLTGGGMSGGYRKYLKNILPRFAVHPDVSSVVCISPETLSVRAWFKPIAKLTFGECKPYDIFGRPDKKLSGTLDHFKPDVIFIPMERYFRHQMVPVVCMLTNMLPMVKVNRCSNLEKIRNIVQKQVAKHAVSKSKRVIAVSQFVRDFMHEEWNVSLKKIGVVYHGVDIQEGNGGVVPSTAVENWRGDFIFIAGAIEPYRGIEDVLDAAAVLREAGINPKVVIAGGVRPSMNRYFEKLKKNVADLKLRANIYWAGSLKEKEMIWCYNYARIFVMSSKVEACPNTALEAMSHGNVIISTYARPMPELFGKAAQYYVPGDYKTLASRILTNQALTNDKRAVIAGIARERAARYSWDETVNNTVNELKLALM